MARQFDSDELVIATHNKGKIPELKELFGDRVKKLYTSADLGVPEPEETGTTFIQNALIKAVTTAKATGKPALADDSGICVDALDGAPGVYTANWAEQPDGKRDWNMAMKKVHDAMAGTSNTKAFYVSCLALAWPDGHYEVAEGRAYGNVVWPPRGDKGFGFDPMFVPEGDTRTYGEMDMDEKNATNHRAVAFKKMIAKCFP